VRRAALPRPTPPGRTAASRSSRLSSAGPNHPQAAVILSSIAAAYSLQSRQDEALKLYERARQIKENVYGARSRRRALGIAHRAPAVSRCAALLR
jgi:hypothetical protein